MRDVQCPYCRASVEINHDDGYGYEEGETYEQECSCGKTFGYTTSIIFTHDVFKAPCMNDGEHDWQDVHGCPVGYQSNRLYCSVCNKDELKDPSLKYNNEKDVWEKELSHAK